MPSRCCVVALVGLAMSAGPAVAAAPRCPPSSCRAVAENNSWRHDVMDPHSATIFPARVTVIGDPGSVTDAAQLAHPTGRGTTITSSVAGASTLLLDMGTNVGGRVEVRVLRSSGAPIRLAYSEGRRYLTPEGDSNGGSLGTDDDPDGRFDLIPASPHPVTFTSPGIRGAERWISVSLDGPGAATIDFVHVIYDGYRPGARNYVGHFLSSDRLVNRTWYSSVYTQNLDSIKAPRADRVVVDGAKRDRLVWLGDLAVEGLAAFYFTPGAVGVVRDSIAVFSCQQEANGFLPEASPIETRCPARDPTAPAAHVSPSPLVDAVPIGSYTPWWIVALYNYYLYTGDAAFVRQQLPVVPRALAWLASREQGGLYDASLTNELNWHPFDNAAGVDAHTNSVYYESLRDAAKLERTLAKNAGLAAQYDDHARAVRAAIIGRLWDPKAGALRGNTADPRANHTQDANVYGVVAGVLTGSRAEQALRFVSRHLYTRLGPVNGQFKDDPWMGYYISPYISSWELWARFEQGDGTGALSLDRRLFGYMAQADPGTMWEKVAVDGTPAAYTATGAGSTSLAHGWSGGPASTLPAFVLGVRPVEPGFTRWVIAPEPSGLRWAQGQVPSPRGTFVSRWIRGAHSFRMSIRAPRGTSGTVEVPQLGLARSIYIDGRLAWRGGRPATGVRAHRVRGRAVAFAGIRGAHVFAWIA